jgi:hypothetical protein
MPGSWDNHAPFVILSSSDDPDADILLKPRKNKVIMQFIIV